MSKISSQKAFQQALSDLPLAQQRQVGARFIEHVLDLSSEPRFDTAFRAASRADVSSQVLQDAYHAVYALYVKSHPRSDLSDVNYHKQAVHFIAEACLTCLAPTYHETKAHHLAEKVAMYCRMARVCANIPHEQDYPNLEAAEQAMRAETLAQYGIVSEYLGD